MKKKRSQRNFVPVTLPDTATMYWTSRGFDFFLQSLQLCAGGIAMYGVLRLLCSEKLDPTVLRLILCIFLLPPILCGAGWMIEGTWKKRWDKPIAGLTDDCFYVQDGLGASLPLDWITEIRYRFGQLRKRGAYAALILYPKAGKPVEAVLPSIALVWALRKALPSVKWRVSWITRLMICLLIGISVGGITALVLLIF